MSSKQFGLKPEVRRSMGAGGQPAPMSFRHPHHHRSGEPGPESGQQPPTVGEPAVARRRRRDAELAYLAGAVEVGRLHCVEQEICATTGGTVVGIDVVACGPLDGAVATSRHLLNGIDDDDALVEANALLVGEALAALADRGSAWPPGVEGFVTVTLDGRFIGHESFLSSVKEATRAAGLEPRQLLLSVEADLGLAASWPSLQRLKSHGVRVAIERFRLGTPANDLVSRFPLDVVRVDVAGLGSTDGDDPQSELESIVRLAEDLRCRVMAEHFSCQAQVEMALETGCDLVVLPPPTGLG